MKFLIVSLQRSGTHYLRSLLNTHPEIDCFNELLVDNKWNKEEILRGNLLMSQKPNKGFVVQCDYSNYTIFSKLASWKPKIIFLWRNDNLARFVSLKLAKLSKVWVVDEKEKTNNTGTINSAEYLAAGRQIRINQDEYDNYKDKCHIKTELAIKTFAQCQQITVEYESISESMGQVQDFLGVPRAQLTESTHKIVTQPISEIVLNYSDIKI